MNKANLTEAELIILDILQEGSKHGYDIDKLIEYRGVRDWANIGFSSVYYILDKLEGKGYASSKPGAINRKVYSITKAGLQTCRLETEQLIAGRVTSKNPFMVGLAGSGTIANTDKLLLARKKDLLTQLDALKQRQTSQQPLPKHAGRLFSYSLAMMQAEINWINKEIGGKYDKNRFKALRWWALRIRSYRHIAKPNRY